MLGIRIRMGAAHYDLTTPDRAVLDMARLDPSAKRKLSRLVRDIYSIHIQGN